MYDKQEFIQIVNASLGPGVIRLDTNLLRGLIEAGAIEIVDGLIPRSQVKVAVQLLGVIQSQAGRAVKKSADDFKKGIIRRYQIAQWAPMGEHDEAIRRTIQERHIWYYATKITVNVEDDDTLDFSPDEYDPELGIILDMPPTLMAALLKYRKANILIPGVPPTWINIHTIDKFVIDRPSSVWIGFLQEAIESQRDVLNLAFRAGYVWAFYPLDVLQREQRSMYQLLYDWIGSRLMLMSLDDFRRHPEISRFYFVPPSDEWTDENVEEQPEYIPVYRFYGWLDYCWFRFIEDIERSVGPRLCVNCGLPLPAEARSNRKYHHKEENAECYRDWQKEKKRKQRMQDR